MKEPLREEEMAELRAQHSAAAAKARLDSPQSGFVSTPMPDGSHLVDMWCLPSPEGGST